MYIAYTQIAQVHESFQYMASAPSKRNFIVIRPPNPTALEQTVIPETILLTGPVLLASILESPAGLTEQYPDGIPSDIAVGSRAVGYEGELFKPVSDVWRRSWCPSEIDDEFQWLIYKCDGNVRARGMSGLNRADLIERIGKVPVSIKKSAVLRFSVVS